MTLCQSSIGRIQQHSVSFRVLPLKYIDVFPFAQTREGLRFLLMKRSPDNSYPGIWQPVAGKIKHGETAWQGGLRELTEETGFSSLNFYALDHVSTFYLHQSDEILQVPAFAAEVPLENPALNHEHDVFQWLDLEGAIQTASWQPHRRALEAIPHLLETPPALALAQIPVPVLVNENPDKDINIRNK